jgi:hypothetical protein
MNMNKVDMLMCFHIVMNAVGVYKKYASAGMIPLQAITITTSTIILVLYQ